MMKKLLFLSFIIWHLYGYENLVPKQDKRNMTTSVIVPCVARHFFWLSGLLESYQNQTVRPDEIVISLSEVEKLNSREIDKLETGLWDCKLKVLRNNGVIIDGENRTIAMDNSTGDILVFSDADDLVHPQRIEIVKYFFENYEVDHIMHCYAVRRDGITPINIDTIPVWRFGSLRDVLNTGAYITCGSPCFLRKIGERIKWHATQDVEYNNRVYQLYRNNIVLPLNLILYRVHLSSHGA
jgi:cellulose synthase/poly-beta-1,6-N-acetylglucosamine synthase-like glycosyltransferase